MFTSFRAVSRPRVWSENVLIIRTHAIPAGMDVPGTHNMASAMCLAVPGAAFLAKLWASYSRTVVREAIHTSKQLLGVI